MLTLYWKILLCHHASNHIFRIILPEKNIHNRILIEVAICNYFLSGKTIL